MSFPIVLMTSKSNVNVVNKSLSTVATATGVLRASTSIIDPVVTIESQLAAELISLVNYAKIATFNRYYYVTNIISLYNGLWELHMHVDVLMSFRDSILAQKALVARQQYNYNLYLDDGSFMAYQNPDIDVVPFDVSSPFNESGTFIMIGAGGATTASDPSEES